MDPYEQLSRLQKMLDGAKALPLIDDPSATVEGGFDFRVGDFLIIDTRAHPFKLNWSVCYHNPRCCKNPR